MPPSFLKKLAFLFGFILCSVFGPYGWAHSTSKHPTTHDLKQWFEENITPVAQDQGIPDDIIQNVYQQLQIRRDVVRLDKNQPEKKSDFITYQRGFLDPAFVEKAKKHLDVHKNTLNTIQQHYHVQPEIVVALWGIETHFGQQTGKFNLFSSLSTLAFEGRRSAFFTRELIEAMRMLHQNPWLSTEIRSSWAGATGQTQFMPSSYMAYAVDFDGDGKKDIWSNTADALASIANYLHQHGWDPESGWSQRVKMTTQTVNLKHAWSTERPIEEWITLGLQPVNTKFYGNHQHPATLIKVDELDQLSFLVYKGYFVLRKWNKSKYFALTVGELADRLQPTVQQ